MKCRHPEAFYLARDPLQLVRMIQGVEPGCCYDDRHAHRIMRLWCLAFDLLLKDA